MGGTRCRHGEEVIWSGVIWCLNYLLNPWSRVLLEKLIGSQPVKKCTAFYGKRRFITVFTSARHLSLSWARSIHVPRTHYLNLVPKPKENNKLEDQDKMAWTGLILLMIRSSERLLWMQHCYEISVSIKRREMLDLLRNSQKRLRCR